MTDVHAAIFYPKEPDQYVLDSISQLSAILVADSASDDKKQEITAALNNFATAIINQIERKAHNQKHNIQSR